MDLHPQGHNYRVIVSDLDRERPIWVGGEGRKEADIDLFFKALGEKRVPAIELMAMDMWKAFRNSVTEKRTECTSYIYDKFHIMRHGFQRPSITSSGAVSSAARTGVTSRASDIPCSRDART